MREERDRMGDSQEGESPPMGVHIKVILGNYERTYVEPLHACMCAAVAFKKGLGTKSTYLPTFNRQRLSA